MLIQITLEQSSPPVGSVAVGSGAAVTPFCGWLDLMATLSEIVGAPGDVEDELRARPKAELREDV